MTATEPAARAARVVVGVDGSDSSLQAIRWAAFLADTMHAGLEAIIGWDWAALGFPTYPGDVDPAGNAQQIIDQALDKVFGENQRPANFAATCRQGYPARTLLDAGQDADLLVVGSRGHGGFVGMLLGGVSAAVAEHATCPVLVVHGSMPPPPSRLT